MQILRIVIRLLPAACAWLWFTCWGGAQPSSPAIEQQAYVWQRAWTPAMRDAIQSHATNFQRLVVLAAEVTWRGGKPRLVPVPVEYDALHSAGIELGLALRIGPYLGPFRSNREPCNLLVDLGRKLVQEASAQGAKVCELQLDFDCAESKLAGYRVWLEAFRERLAPLPVTITALPSWLRQPEFGPLVTVAGSYVLQAHSLERPTGPDAPFTLCDPAAALRAVEQAGRLRVPFRVALPTYGYQIAFDATGKFVGLAAEARDTPWPEHYRIREVGAEPDALAGLVRAWSAKPPPCLQSIIWYRLPVRGDRLNWSWPTLAAVMAGRTPRAQLRFATARPSPGLVEITLYNEGEATAVIPREVRLRWEGGRLLAGDGIGGFVLEDEGQREVTVKQQGTTASGQLRPGGRRPVAWLRFKEDEEVRIEMVQD